MKRILTIAAIAVLAAFISCSPDASVSDYDYKRANERYNPEESSTQVAYPSIDLVTINTTSVNPRLVISFPAQADILKNPSKAELDKFLTVHEFSNPDGANWIQEGKSSVISSPIPYDFIKIDGNKIEIEVKIDYAARTLAGQQYSPLRLKFDGKGYTVLGGLTKDVDRNGIPAEPVYDDFWREVSVTGSQTWTWVAPGNKGWSLSLITPAPGGLTFDPVHSETANVVSFNAAQIYFNTPTGFTGNADANAAYRTAVTGLFKDSVKLQEFSGSAWVDVKTATFDDTIGSATYQYLRFVDVALKNNSLYRVRWTGKANLETEAVLFGVKQRIHIAGGTPSSSSFPKENYTRTEIVSTANYLCENSQLTSQGSIRAVEVIKDSLKGDNVVLRVWVPIEGFSSNDTDLPYVGLISMGKEAFLESFKIVRRPNGGTISAYETATDLAYVKITDVKFLADGSRPDGEKNTNFNNVIEITLDKNYIWDGKEFFLINDGLKYTKSGNMSRAFGDQTKYAFGKFRLYTPQKANLPIVVTAGGGSGDVRITDEGNGIYKVDTTSATGAYIEIFYNAEYDQSYVLSFTAKSTANATISVWHYYFGVNSSNTSTVLSGASVTSSASPYNPTADAYVKLEDGPSKFRINSLAGTASFTISDIVVRKN